MKKIPAKREDLLIGILVAVVFLFFSFNPIKAFESLERTTYGIEMRLDSPTTFAENNIAIVEIDDKSVDQLGPWPWPRHLIADMITILKENGAKLIALDMLYSAKEPTQGLDEVRDLRQAILDKGELPEEDAWILDRLRDTEKKLDNDKILCQAVKESGNVILPVEGRFGDYNTKVVSIQGSYLERNSLNLSGIKWDFGQFISRDRRHDKNEHSITQCRSFVYEEWIFHIKTHEQDELYMIRQLHDLSHKRPHLIREVTQ